MRERTFLGFLLPGSDRLQLPPMKNELSIAFIGGEGRVRALAARPAGKVCAARDVHVIDINQHATRASQAGRPTGARARNGRMARTAGALFARATRNMQGVAASTRQWMQDNVAVARMTAVGAVRGPIGACRQ